MTHGDPTSRSDSGELCCTGNMQRRLIPLFSGGTFDAGFNGAETRQPISISTPEGTERAYIEAVITGTLLGSLCLQHKVGAQPELPC